jgi:hypothetical protein
VHAEDIALLQRRVSLGMLIVVTVLLSLPARAGRARAVVHVEGPNAPALVAEIRAALPPGIAAASAKRFETLVSRDRRGALRRALSSGKELPDVAARVERALAPSGADVAIVVHAARPQRGQRAVQILVVAAGRPERHFFRSTSERTSDSRADRIAWWAGVLAEALAQASTPPSMVAGAGTSPTRAESGPASALRDDPISPDHTMSPRASPEKALAREDWRVMAALEASYRRFDDSEGNARTDRTYQALPVPGFSIGTEMYPIANGRIGFAAAYARSVGVRSTTNDGRVVGTTWSRIEASGRIRFPTADRPGAPWIGALAGYAYSGFSFDIEPSRRQVPVAEYHMARAGVDARVPIDRLIAVAGAEVDWLFHIAPLGDVAARGGGMGIIARAGVGYRATRLLMVRVDGRYARMFFGLQRDVSATVVDQYFTLGLGVEASF